MPDDDDNDAWLDEPSEDSCGSANRLAAGTSVNLRADLLRDLLADDGAHVIGPDQQVEVSASDLDGEGVDGVEDDNFALSFDFTHP